MKKNIINFIKREKNFLGIIGFFFLLLILSCIVDSKDYAISSMDNNTIETTTLSNFITTNETTFTTTITTISTTVKSITTKKTEMFFVYNEESGRVHRSDCIYYDSTMEKINGNSVECGTKCVSCNPEIIIEEENITEETYEDNEIANNYYDNDIIYLQRIVAHEYGADWVDIPEKARIVAAVMNRVYDSRFPNSVYEVLTQPGQFTGFSPDYDCYISDSVAAAVEYYFNNSNSFDGSNSWSGDGYSNYFYFQ